MKILKDNPEKKIGNKAIDYLTVRRICKTCGRYAIEKIYCSILKIEIKFPDCPYCSWWIPREKHEN